MYTTFLFAQLSYQTGSNLLAPHFAFLKWSEGDSQLLWWNSRHSILLRLFFCEKHAQYLERKHGVNRETLSLCLYSDNKRINALRHTLVSAFQARSFFAKGEALGFTAVVLRKDLLYYHIPG